MKVEKIIKETITSRVAGELYNLIKIGEKIYYEILHENEELFNSSFENGLKNRLKAVITYKQFDKKYLSDDFSFETTITQVNSFGYKIPELKRGNILLNIFNTKAPHLLPSCSRYKKERAFNNGKYIQRQVNLDYFSSSSNDNKEIFIDSPLYALLTYNYCGKNKFVNIIVPSYDFSSVEYSIDLQKMWLNNSGHLQISEKVKNNRINLKKEILQDLRRGILNG